MSKRAGRDLVAVRAAVVAGLSLVLATVAHASAGGLLPSPTLVLGMALLCFVACAAWLGRETSRTSLVLLLVSAQTTIHFTMTALAGHGGDTGRTATTPAAALLDAGHHIAHDALHDAPMMTAHLVAAALTGLALGHAERALWAVLGLLARAARFVVLVLQPLAVPMTARPLAHRSDVDLPLLHARLLTGASVVRRGPPALLAAR